MQEFNWFILPNGIRCVHHRTKSEVAYVAITIGAGTRDEQPSEHGVAHLTEHLLFKGTEHRSAFHIGNRLESHGGDLNAYTTKEETAVHATCLKSDYRRAIDLLADMVFRSKFADKDIEAEREVIIDEINSYKDSPSELIFDDFEEELFKGTALGRNILGDKRRLAAIRRSDVTDYTRRTFTTDQIVVSSSGNISFERFQCLCEEILGPIAPTTAVLDRQSPDHRETFSVTRNKHTHQTHCLIGGYAYNNTSENRIPLAVMTNILGGPFSLSLLNQSLREKRSLTYNVETSYTPYADSGVFSIYYGSENNKSAQAQELIDKELKGLRDNLLSTGKFHRFKRQFLGQLVIGNESQESLMLAVAKSLLVFNGFDTTEALYRKVETVTREDILRVSAEVLDTSNLSTLIYQ